MHIRVPWSFSTWLQRLTSIAVLTRDPCPSSHMQRSIAPLRPSVTQSWHEPVYDPLGKSRGLLTFASFCTSNLFATGISCHPRLRGCSPICRGCADGDTSERRRCTTCGNKRWTLNTATTNNTTQIKCHLFAAILTAAARERTLVTLQAIATVRFLFPRN